MKWRWGLWWYKIVRFCSVCNHGEVYSLLYSLSLDFVLYLKTGIIPFLDSFSSRWNTDTWNTGAKGWALSLNCFSHIRSTSPDVPFLPPFLCYPRGGQVLLQTCFRNNICLFFDDKKVMLSCGKFEMKQQKQDCAKISYKLLSVGIHSIFIFMHWDCMYIFTTYH